MPVSVRGAAPDRVMLVWWCSSPEDQDEWVSWLQVQIRHWRPPPQLFRQERRGRAGENPAEKWVATTSHRRPRSQLIRRARDRWAVSFRGLTFDLNSKPLLFAVKKTSACFKTRCDPSINLSIIDWTVTECVGVAWIVEERGKRGHKFTVRRRPLKTFENFWHSWFSVSYHLRESMLDIKNYAEMMMMKLCLTNIYSCLFKV